MEGEQVVGVVAATEAEPAQSIGARVVDGQGYLDWRDYSARLGM